MVNYKMNKKIIIPIIILCLIILCIFLSMSIFNKPKNKNIQSESVESVFIIDKILLYSSVNARDNSQGGLLQDLDIHQFTDIAIYIDNKTSTKDLTPKNTVKEISIYNISIDAESDTGEKIINYKNPLLYGKFEYLPQGSNQINFDVIKTNDENTETIYNSPVFFADCSNPISIRISEFGDTQTL